MALAAGSYRGRVGDRAFFTGTPLGASPYAGAGPYSPQGVGFLPAMPAYRRVRFGATRMAHMRQAFQHAYPAGMNFAGVTLGSAPIPHRKVLLPSGHTVIVY